MCQKAVKALLDVRKKVVYNHDPELIAIFAETYSSEWIPEFDYIVRALEFLQEYYTRARYPVLFRGEVYSPSDLVTEEIASRGIELASKTLEVVEDYLKSRSIP